MTNSAPLLLNFKKLYLYYLRRIINTSFWITISLGVIWSGFVSFKSWEGEKAKIQHQREVGKIEKEFADGKINKSKKEKEIGKLLNKIERDSYFGHLNLKHGISTSLADFGVEKILLGTLLFSLIWIIIPLNVDTTIRTLLGWTTVSNPSLFTILKPEKMQRTGEDEMVLTFASTTTRRTIALSKFLAYLTHCLIFNFVSFILPFLLNFANWTNHLGSSLKLLLLGGVFFPILIYGSHSLFFWWVELVNYFLIIILPLLIFAAYGVAILGREKQWFQSFLDFLFGIVQNPLLLSSATLLILAPFDLLFLYRYRRDFETTDFS